MNLRYKSVVALLAFSALTAVGLATPAMAQALPKPVITIISEGGFVAPAWTVSRLPIAQVYADGSVVIPDPKPVHNYVRSAKIGRVSVQTVRSWVATLSRQTVTPKGGWGFPGVADVPSTRIVISTAGKSVNVSILALGFSRGLTKAQTQARVALAATVATITPASSRPYHPASYEVWGLAPLLVNNSGGMGMPNPASVYCQSTGGTSGIVDTPDGQAGTCTFQDGTVVDEWQNYRQALATKPVWPSGYSVPASALDGGGTRCMVMAASSVVKQLANSDDQGQWLLPSGQAFPVVLRPILPGESGCHR